MNEETAEMMVRSSITPATSPATSPAQQEDQEEILGPCLETLPSSGETTPTPSSPTETPGVVGTSSSPTPDQSSSMMTSPTSSRPPQDSSTLALSAQTPPRETEAPPEMPPAPRRHISTTPAYRRRLPVASTSIPFTEVPARGFLHLGSRTVEHLGEDLPDRPTAREPPLRHLGVSRGLPRPGVRPPVEMELQPFPGEEQSAEEAEQAEARAERRRAAAQQRQQQRDHQAVLQRQFMARAAELLALLRERRQATGAPRQTEQELMGLPILLHQLFRLTELMAEEFPTLLLTLLEALLEAVLG